MKHSLAFLLTIVAAAYACKKDESVAPLPHGYVELRMGQQVLTPVGLAVIADTVRMSICPKTAACFAPDNVSASLRVVRAQESQSVRLFAGFGTRFSENVNRSDSTSVRLGGQLYKVILSGQYIGETEQSKLGRAIVQVSKL